MTSGVVTGPTVSEGTVTDGVEEGAGTLDPPGRPMSAGTAVSVGAAASVHANAASVTAAANAARRNTPAVFIPEYPRPGTVAGFARRV